MLRLIPGTLAVLLSVLLLAAAFTGIGLLVRRAWGLAAETSDDCLMAFWMGFATVLFLLILWNFALPINGYALGLFLAAGAAGLWRARRDLASAFAHHAARPPARTLVALGLVGLWIANISSGHSVNWDSALYHSQGIQWAATYRVVPGLANLFGALGFNNAGFLYDAMVDIGPWHGRAYHVANAVFVLVFAAQAVLASARLGTGAQGSRHVALFSFLLLAAGLTQVQQDRGASFATDVAPTLVLLSMAAHWYGILAGPRREPREDGYSLFCLVTLAALAVSLKLNAAIFAALAVITAGLVWLARGTDHAVRRKALAWSVASGLLFGGAWTARSVVLSGYPLFPNRMFAMPVDWRAPEAHAAAEFALIVDSGRGTLLDSAVVTGHAGAERWFPRWLRRLEREPYTIPVATVVALAGFTAAIALRRRASSAARAATGAGWWALVPALGAIGAWASVSPEARYASAAFWTLAALGVSQAVRLAEPAADAPAWRRLRTAGWVLGLSPLLVTSLSDWNVTGRRGNPVVEVVKLNVRIPPAGYWLPPVATHHTTTPWTTRSGLVLNRPAKLCGNAPLPCTPNPSPNLRLRVAGRLDRGFMVDGPWQMTNWPDWWAPDYLRELRVSGRLEHPGTE